MNRLQAIERLKLGRALALEVPGALAGQRAFVFIRPQIDQGKVVPVSADWSIEPSVRRNVPNQDVVREYEVAYTELKPGWETSDDWEDSVFQRDEFAYATVAELEAALRARWGRELQEFRLPHDVDHPF